MHTRVRIEEHVDEDVTQITVFNIPGQGKAGQGRAGQGRAGQGRAGQGRAGQGKARQGKARQGRNRQQHWGVTSRPNQIKRNRQDYKYTG